MSSGRLWGPTTLLTCYNHWPANETLDYIASANHMTVTWTTRTNPNQNGNWQRVQWIANVMPLRKSASIDLGPLWCHPLSTVTDTRPILVHSHSSLSVARCRLQLRKLQPTSSDKVQLLSLHLVFQFSTQSMAVRLKLVFVGCCEPLLCIHYSSDYNILVFAPLLWSTSCYRDRYAPLIHSVIGGATSNTSYRPAPHVPHTMLMKWREMTQWAIV